MSGLTEDQKLVWLGIRQATHTSSDGAGIIAKLQDAFGDEYDDFLDAYEAEDPADFDEFEAFLVDNDTEDAGAIRNTFESRYETFAEFDDDVRSFDSYIELQNSFGSGSGLRSDLTDDDGDPVAGIKVYESAGVGTNGQSIPAGGVEVFGDEVYFSKSTPFEEPDEDFEYANLQVSNTTPVPGQTITVSATVSNPSSDWQAEIVQFFEDGDVYSSSFVTVPGNDSTTVEFEWSSSEYKSVELTIGPLPPETVTVIHPSL